VSKNHDCVIISLLILLILLMLACKVPSVGISKPTAIIPVSSEAADNLKSSIGSALEQAEKSGKVSLVITESQITSYVTYELQSQTEPQVSDLQIYLRDGQIKFYFTIQQNGISFPGQCFVNVQSDDKGGLTVEILSAKIGPLPFTDDMKKMLSEEIKKAISGQIYTENSNLYIDSISIANGEMLIQGHTK
jgi:hypothetical protein